MNICFQASFAKYNAPVCIYFHNIYIVTFIFQNVHILLFSPDMQIFVHVHVASSSEKIKYGFIRYWNFRYSINLGHIILKYNAFYATPTDFFSISTSRIAKYIPVLRMCR